MNTIWMSWSDVFNLSLQQLWWGFIQFAPRLVFAIILFIVGWMLGALIAKAFEQVLNTLKIDKLFASIGADDLFKKAGMTLNVGYFIGQVMKWFVIVLFLMPSLSVLGLDTISMFLQSDVLGFLPKVIVAAFILIIATIVSQAISKAIMAGAKSMNISSANMLATVAKYAVWVFAFIIALGQLGIAPYYMQILFTGIVAMLSLGGALAFGLGGKEHASRFLSKMENEMSNK